MTELECTDSRTEPDGGEAQGQCIALFFDEVAVVSEPPRVRYQPTHTEQVAALGLSLFIIVLTLSTLFLCWLQAALARRGGAI